MTGFVTAIRGFAAFWWDFIVGDDWRIAAAVVVALAATAAVAATDVAAWWILPVAVVAILLMSLRSSTRIRIRRPDER
jgi:hypothetical protein